MPRLLIAVFVALAAAANVYADTSDALKGRWQGEIDLGGIKLGLAVGFRLADGQYVGQMDIQGMKGLPLEAIRFDAPAVHFEFDHETGRAVFSGAMSGASIAGDFEKGSDKGTFTLAKVQPADIGPAVLAHMKSENIPGAAVAVVRDGSVVWTDAWGFADVAAKKPATADSLFHLASVSKTITATSLVMLQAAGKFKLDDDINAYLPFAVRNPNAPGTPITFAQLLQHRSSIRDDITFYGPLWDRRRGTGKRHCLNICRLTSSKEANTTTPRPTSSTMDRATGMPTAIPAMR